VARAAAPETCPKRATLARLPTLRRELAAERERALRAEGETLGLRDAAEGARADREAALARLVLLEGELTRLQESVTRLAGVEGELTGVGEALTEARRPWWRHWGAIRQS
jgi:hypothetical protein